MAELNPAICATMVIQRVQSRRIADKAWMAGPGPAMTDGADTGCTTETDQH
jgi:hypothetical protein